MRFQSLIAEFIGTFALVFVGMIAVIAATPGTFPPSGGGGNLLTVALAHGFIIAVMASATAAISGGHLNPAVTIGMLVGGKTDLIHAIGYIVIQMVAGVAAALSVRALLPFEWLELSGFAIPRVSGAILDNPAMIIEAILTGFLMFVILGTAVDKRAPKVGALFIGLTVTLDILVGGPLTGAALNPARWFGPATLAGDFDGTMVYVLGPILGAVVAALIYRFMLEERKMPVVPDEERVA